MEGQPSGYEDKVEEKHVAARDIQPKRGRKIKKLVREEETKTGNVVSVGKSNGKHKDQV